MALSELPRSSPNPYSSPTSSEEELAVVKPVHDKPENGIRGLKHLRHDIVSGIVVSLVSLPLSSGIAIASGAPPIYGLISAIIAGLIFPFLGGAYVTIAGPAAGLAPALLGIMATLGGAGDADHVGAGYPFLLVVIFFVGISQLVLSGLRLARYAAMIPVSVVEGMLASIGLLIIVKQLPSLLGYTGKVHAHEFFQYVTESPEFFRGGTQQVMWVSGLTLVLLFWLGTRKWEILKVLPPQLAAVIVGVALGLAFNLGQNFRITLPENPFHGIHLPDFSGLSARQDLWQAVIIGVITLTLIDGVESLATAMAIDRIDPFHRQSKPNRLLMAMGVSNILSSLVGGLTIIPGGVKSKANIASGGRTLWANFTNAICLILYLVVARDLINLIPKGVLASVLIYTGWKMCEPLVWKKIASVGWEQLGIFTFTILATLLSDLLWGIIAGTIAKYILNLVVYHYAAEAEGKKLGFVRSMGALFMNPVGATTYENGVYQLHVDKPVVCFNAFRLVQSIEKAPKGAEKVEIHLDSLVSLVDHSSSECLLHAADGAKHGGIPVEIVGMDRFRTWSDHHASLRVLNRNKDNDVGTPSTPA